MNNARPQMPDNSGEDTVVLRLFGEYDIYRQSELDAELQKAYRARLAVLDLTDVSYIDSTSIALFIRLRKRMAEHGGGTVKLAGAQANVRRVLELTRLDEVFELCDSAEDALD